MEEPLYAYAVKKVGGYYLYADLVYHHGKLRSDMPMILVSSNKDLIMDAGRRAFGKLESFLVNLAPLVKSGTISQNSILKI